LKVRAIILHPASRWVATFSQPVLTPHGFQGGIRGVSEQIDQELIQLIAVGLDRQVPPV